MLYCHWQGPDGKGSVARMFLVDFLIGEYNLGMVAWQGKIGNGWTGTGSEAVAIFDM